MRINKCYQDAGLRDEDRDGRPKDLRAEARSYLTFAISKGMN